MKRIFVSFVLIGVLVIVVFLGVSALMGNKPRPRRAQPHLRAVRARAPKIQPVTNKRVTIVGYGTAQPRTRLEIAPRVSGEIIYKSDAFRSGRLVRGPGNDQTPGEVLFRLDPEPFQLSVDNAQQGVALLEAQLASLKQEQANLQATQKLQEEMVLLEKKQIERVQSVFKRGVGTQNEVDLARATYLTRQNQLQETQNQLRLIPQRRRVLEVQLEDARVKLRQAKLDLGYATYRCPVTGRILNAEAELGEQVQAGQVCGEMYGTDRMEILVSIPAADIRWLDPSSLKACIEQNPDRKGAKLIEARVTWSVPGGRTLAWSGGVERIEAGVEARTRTAGVIVAVDNTKQADRNRDDFYQLDINMYCKVTIFGRVVPKAFLLPRSAVQPDDTVFVAQPDAKVHTGYRLEKRKIEIARFTDNQAMVLAGGGLHAGDRVVLQAPPKAVLGMALKVMDTAETPETRPATLPTTNESQ